MSAAQSRGSVPWLEDADVTLYHGDVLNVLPELPTKSVDCVVTSPPYLDARPEYPSPSLIQFEDIFRELGRVLQSDGSILLNVGRLFRDGRELLWWHDLIVRAEWAGWSVIDTIIWTKPNALGRGGPYLTNAHEYIFWLGTPESYRGYDDTRTPHSPETVARRLRGDMTAAKGHPRRTRVKPLHPGGARPRSVVSFVVGRAKGNPHPAPMPLDLAEHLVKLGCPIGGTVLDPFVGSGTTMLAARTNGRNSIGIDLNAEYLELAARRLQQQSLFAGVESGF